MNKEELLQVINEYQKLEESVEQLKGEVHGMWQLC